MKIALKRRWIRSRGCRAWHKRVRRPTQHPLVGPVVRATAAARPQQGQILCHCQMPPETCRRGEKQHVRDNWVKWAKSVYPDALGVWWGHLKSRSEVSCWLLISRVVWIQAQKISNSLKTKIWNPGQNLLMLSHISAPVVARSSRIQVKDLG